MTIRLRFRYRPALRRARNANRALAVAMASVLSPASVMAIVLGFWKLGADMNITGEFAISGGIFSHWQVWIAIGIVLQAAAIIISKVAMKADYDDKLAV